MMIGWQRYMPYVNLPVTERKGCARSCVKTVLKPESAVSVMSKARTIPPIHDITTNIQDPPQFSAAVIAARAGALPEVVGESALLVDPRSPAAITDAMVRLGRERSLAASLAAAGPRRAALFRWSDTAARVTALLEECA